MTNELFVLMDDTIVLERSHHTTILGRFTNVDSALDTVAAYTDTLESSATTIKSYTDTVESTIRTVKSFTDTLESSASTIKSYTDTIESSLDNIEGFVDAAESMLETNETDILAVDDKIGSEYLNVNGVPEVDNIRAHLFKCGGKGGGVTTKMIAYDGSVSYAAFTVTGLVWVNVVGIVNLPLSNHGDTTSVGTASGVGGLIVATAGTAMQTGGQVWINNTPSKFMAVSALVDQGALIGGGDDIVVLGTANLATGTVTLYCFWTPISSDGQVTAV